MGQNNVIIHILYDCVTASTDDIRNNTKLNSFLFEKKSIIALKTAGCA